MSDQKVTEVRVGDTIILFVSVPMNMEQIERLKHDFAQHVPAGVRIAVACGIDRVMVARGGGNLTKELSTIDTSNEATQPFGGGVDEWLANKLLTATGGEVVGELMGATVVAKPKMGREFI